MKRLPARVIVYVTAVRVLALIMFALLLLQAQVRPLDRNLGTAVLLALLTGVAAGFPVHIGPKRKVQADTAAIFAAVLLLPAPLAMLAAGIGRLGAGIARRQKSLEASFNAAVRALSAGIAAVSLHLVTPYPLTVAPNLQSGTLTFALLVSAGAVTYYVTQGWLVQGAISLQLRQDPVASWFSHQRRVLPQELSLMLIGVVAALAAREQFWSLAILALPAYIVYRSLRDGVALRVQTKDTIENLADIVDMRDHYTFEHSKRVAQLSRELARRLGLEAEQAETIYLAARVHDVGKIGIGSHVLNKPGSLTDDEWSVMRGHPEIGARLTDKFPDFRGTRALILHHHERFDGKGYPLGLAGDRIPFGARIIAVADTYDAMTTQRAYRPPLPFADVLAELRRGRGSQFDPRVVETFLKMIEPDTPQDGDGGRQFLPSGRLVSQT